MEVTAGPPPEGELEAPGEGNPRTGKPVSFLKQATRRLRLRCGAAGAGAARGLRPLTSPLRPHALPPCSLPQPGTHAQRAPSGVCTGAHLPRQHAGRRCRGRGCQGNAGVQPRTAAGPAPAPAAAALAGRECAGARGYAVAVVRLLPTLPAASAAVAVACSAEPQHTPLMLLLIPAASAGGLRAAGLAALEPVHPGNHTVRCFCPRCGNHHFRRGCGAGMRG